MRRGAGGGTKTRGITAGLVCGHPVDTARQRHLPHRHGGRQQGKAHAPQTIGAQMRAVFPRRVHPVAMFVDDDCGFAHSGGADHDPGEFRAVTRRRGHRHPVRERPRCQRNGDGPGDKKGAQRDIHEVLLFRDAVLNLDLSQISYPFDLKKIFLAASVFALMAREIVPAAARPSPVPVGRNRGAPAPPPSWGATRDRLRAAGVVFRRRGSFPLYPRRSGGQPDPARQAIGALHCD